MQQQKFLELLSYLEYLIITHNDKCHLKNKNLGSRRGFWTIRTYTQISTCFTTSGHSKLDGARNAYGKIL